MKKNSSRSRVSTRRVSSVIATSFKILVLVICVIGISTGLLLIKRTLDNRSDAATPAVRTGWLGLAASVQMLPGITNDTNWINPSLQVPQIRGLGSPWIYNWRADRLAYAYFGDNFVPMIWGCGSSDAEFTTYQNHVFNWPKRDFYMMFLNEPDDSHNLCSPTLAAQRLNKLLTHPNKPTGLKVMLAGGVNGPTWIRQMLSEYRRLYGSNPTISGIHVHIYASPNQGNYATTTADQFLSSATAQLANWQQFRTQEQSWLAHKDFWISEMGVLAGDVSDPVMSSFMTKWIEHLATQSYVTRAFWFSSHSQSTFPFAWRFRSSGLHRDMQQTGLYNTFQGLCAKYCPKTTFPTMVSSSAPQTAELETVVLQQKTVDGRHKTRWVTPTSQPDTSFTGSAPVGKFYKTPGAGRVAVHECYIKGWQDYVITTSPSTDKPAAFCTSQEELYRGVIGFASANRSTQATLAIQECVDETNLNHGYSIAANNCEPYTAQRSPRPTVRTGWNFGWLVPMNPGNPTPTPVTPTPSPTTGGADLSLKMASKRTSAGKLKTRLVTELSKPDATLANAVTIGTIYRSAGPGLTPLYECYLKSWDDYLVATFSSGVPHDQFCKSTDTFLVENKGIIGYIYARPTGSATKPLKECADTTNLNHHISLTDPACPSYKTQYNVSGELRESWTYGYIQ